MRCNLHEMGRVLLMFGSLMPATTCLGGCSDINGDGEVDLNDCAAFQRCFSEATGGTPEACGLMDFDGDGDIDLTDFTMLSAVFDGPGTLSGTAEICGDGVDNDCDGLVDGADPDCAVANLAYFLLADRVGENRTQFYIYQDADSGFSHGFPSGFFGDSQATIESITLDAACIDDPAASNGCSTDPERLDRERGTVLRITFPPLPPGHYAGVNIEEPEHWGAQNRGTGYDLRGATELVLDVRTPEALGISVQFGVGGKVTTFRSIPAGSTYQTVRIRLDSLRDPQTGIVSPPDLTSVHLLFGVATNDIHAPFGGTVLLDNIRFEPAPTAQGQAIGFPLANQTFGVLPRGTVAPGRVPIPPDQVLRNLTTTYESALVLIVLLDRHTPNDLDNARLVADAFVYALSHDNSGLPLPPAPDGSGGLRNGYENGDLPLQNDQAPGAARQGEVRLAGFSASALCGPSQYCLVLDGATGGNNAFAMLGLMKAYRQFDDTRYLDTARTIGLWIRGNMTSNTGFGGYFLGYPDEGAEKILIRGKSIENNADIFAAFNVVAGIEEQLGDTTSAQQWREAANFAGDFVMALFDDSSGRFFAGTVPVGTPPSSGIDPTGPLMGDDIINVADFLDANTFTLLALAESERYRDAIDWRRPLRYVLGRFAQEVHAEGQTFSGFDLVAQPTAGPNGIAWEFTAQVVASMQLLDRLYGQIEFTGEIGAYVDQLRMAQSSAPFSDGFGLVAATIQYGEMIPPAEQCLSTPFQCIPERVGLAATTWLLFAEREINPLSPQAP